MSYDISLKHPITRETLLLDDPHFMRGGIYACGGTRECHLNVTYNYASHFRRAIDPETGIRAIYGLMGADSIPVLTAAIQKLGDDVDEDYWKPTEGNAKAALLQLLALAKMRPDGVWDGD
jgi:hypothetical protein